MSGWSEALGAAESSHAFGDLEYEAGIKTLGAWPNNFESDPLLNLGFDASRMRVLQDRMIHDDGISMTGNWGAYSAPHPTHTFDHQPMGEFMAERHNWDSAEDLHAHLVNKGVLKPEYKNFDDWNKSDWVDPNDMLYIWADKLGKMPQKDVIRHEYRHRGQHIMEGEIARQKEEGTRDTSYKSSMPLFSRFMDGSFSEEELMRFFDMEYGNQAMNEEARFTLKADESPGTMSILSDMKIEVEDEAQRQISAQRARELALRPKPEELSWAQKLMQLVWKD